MEQFHESNPSFRNSDSPMLNQTRKSQPSSFNAWELEQAERKKKQYQEMQDALKNQIFVYYIKRNI
jgi:hypothetical protein